MSELTFDKIMETYREMERLNPRPRERGLLDFLRPLPFRLLEAPPPPPKIQVKELLFADGTPILAPQFRASMNAWLTERFGFQDDPFKDKLYIFGNEYLIGNPRNIAMIRNLG